MYGGKNSEQQAVAVFIYLLWKQLNCLCMFCITQVMLVDGQDGVAHV